MHEYRVALTRLRSGQRIRGIILEPIVRLGALSRTIGQAKLPRVKHSANECDGMRAWSVYTASSLVKTRIDFQAIKPTPLRAIATRATWVGRGIGGEVRTVRH